MNVSDWMAYIQTLHPREIELSLERVRQVYRQMFPEGCPFRVISIAGTNGKGSTSELLSSIYKAGGYRAGKFTSPHLCHFNERFSVNGLDVEDTDLLKSFTRVEAARGNVPITFFEYNFLLALDIFSRADVDIALMEVGLGGRLDAVNVLDADVSIITSIAMDHANWLGDTLEKIAFEKAGIARTDRPCIVGVRNAQTSLQRHLKDVKAISAYIDHDFFANFETSEATSKTWSYKDKFNIINDLPLPFAQDGVQLDNAALAINACLKMNDCLPIRESQIKKGIQTASIAGRCQVIDVEPIIILDVAHNEAAVARLREFVLSQDFKGKLVAVCGMLKDKEIEKSLSMLTDLVSKWHLVSIDSDRGSTANDLHVHLKRSFSGNPFIEDNLGQASLDVSLHESALKGFMAAKKTLTANDCLLVFGSFYVVGDILSHVKT